jgi:hypothetical protein
MDLKKLEALNFVELDLGVALVHEICIAACRRNSFFPTPISCGTIAPKRGSRSRSIIMTDRGQP